MIFKEIYFGTDEYKQAFSLRDELLRMPLGLSLHNGDISQENRYLHFGLFDAAGKLEACSVIIPISSTEAEIYHVAVSPSQQKKGLGKKIMIETEKKLQTLGFKYLQMDARLTVVDFYKKLNYVVVGDEYVKLTPTLSHLKMVKNI
ncbi:MAG: GNAT family N-acetyltransferase [Pseudomonadota bacterium]